MNDANTPTGDVTDATPAPPHGDDALSSTTNGTMIDGGEAPVSYDPPSIPDDSEPDAEPSPYVEDYTPPEEGSIEDRLNKLEAYVIDMNREFGGAVAQLIDAINAWEPGAVSPPHPDETAQFQSGTGHNDDPDETEGN